MPAWRETNDDLFNVPFSAGRRGRSSVEIAETLERVRRSESPGMLLAWTCSPMPSVRAIVAAHPLAPDEALERLARDPVPEIAEAAAAALEARRAERTAAEARRRSALLKQPT